MISQAKIFIAIPSYNGILSQMMGTIVSTINYLQSKSITSQLVFKPNCANVDYSRAELTNQFLHSDCTHLFFVDADMSFDGDLLYRMLGTGESLVACAYRSRHPPNYDPLLSMNVPQTTFQGKNGEHLIKVNYTGLGCTLISRESLENACKKFPELKYISKMTGQPGYALFIPLVIEIDGTPSYLSDDYSFFQRMKEAGVSLSCLVDATTNHENIRFCLRDFLTQSEVKEPTKLITLNNIL